MDGYEKIIRVMNDQAKATIKKSHDQENDFGKPLIQIGEMTSETSCKIGKLELEKEDLLFADHLMTKLCKEVKGDNSEYLPPLKAGDRVAIYRANDEQYIVLERLVCL